jgi:hypothetical protein
MKLFNVLNQVGVCKVIVSFLAPVLTFYRCSKIKVWHKILIYCLDDWVYLHHAASTPIDLLNALARHAKKAPLKNIRTTHALLLGDIPFAKDESIYGKFLGNFLNVKN